MSLHIATSSHQAFHKVQQRARLARHVVARRVVGVQGKYFAPQFPIALIEKDFGYTVQAAGAGVRLATITAAHGVFQQAIECGLGGNNMTGVVQLFAQQGAKQA